MGLNIPSAHRWHASEPIHPCRRGKRVAQFIAMAGLAKLERLAVCTMRRESDFATVLTLYFGFGFPFQSTLVPFADVR